MSITRTPTQEDRRAALFSSPLADVLKNAGEHHIDAINLIHNQLDYLAGQDEVTCRQIIHDYYHNNSDNYANLKQEAIAYDEPVITAMYALVTHNINDLDSAKVAEALSWFKQHYRPTPPPVVQSNLSAILTILNAEPGSHLTLPDNATYLNLAGAILPRMDLHELDFSYANLTNANLQGANLTNCCLNKAILDNCNLQGATLDNSQIRFAHMRGTQCDGANMQNAKLERIKTDRNTSFKKANLSHAYLEGIIFHGSLENTCLEHSDLCNSHLYRSDLNLHGARMGGAVFNDNTVFVSPPPLAGPDKRYQTYLANRKQRLSEVRFFKDTDFSDHKKVERAFDDLHIMLGSNLDFHALQPCIAHELIAKVQNEIKPNDPSLATAIYELAYSHPLFENTNLLALGVNLLSRSTACLFASQPQANIVDPFESDCQRQIRLV